MLPGEALVLVVVTDGDGGHDEQRAEVAGVEEAALAAGKAVVFAANAGETVAAVVDGECAG